MGSEQSNAWNLTIEEVDGDWCVCTLVDGERHVVSRHSDRPSAEAAVASMDATSSRGAALRDGAATDATGSEVTRGAEHESPAPRRSEHPTP